MGATVNPNVMWEFFRDKTLKVAGDCVGVASAHRRSCFISKGTLKIIERSHSAQLSREQWYLAIRALRVDKEAYVRGICE